MRFNRRARAHAPLGTPHRPARTVRKGPTRDVQSGFPALERKTLPVTLTPNHSSESLAFY